ncbi:S9 family peptidase [Klugiella xanthotipulae]|uniref:Oligopeptidase B n=1 Tax=Klugiella xanthotipulae TaxID=244735 RepID=A0A543I4D3_9MICO|nr:S9 family peptidase [Klugiella xanthotipulae]TQM65435.1 oligopeptidase B [Klugiella xanthotipulae]
MTTSPTSDTVSPARPHAPQRPTARTHHGDTVIDNYEWLREKDSPEVIAYLEAENAYADARTAHLEPLRESLFTEIKERTVETDMSVPTRLGDWWYYARTVEGQQYGLQCRAPLAGPDDWTPPRLDPQVPVPGEQLLLDGNVEAEGHDFFSLGSFDVSGCGSLLLYSTDTIGDERYTIRIRDLATGRDLPDTIPETSPGAIFAPDAATIYYTTCDEAWRPDTVWCHPLGSSEAPTRVFHEPDERYWVGVGRTRSRRYLIIELGSKITTEYHLLDTREPEAGFRIVWPRREGVEYSVEHAVLNGEDVLLVLHNDGAPNCELVALAPSIPGTGPEGARVVIPHNDTVRLEDVSAFETFITLDYRRDGLTQVALAPVSALAGTLTTADSELAFDEPLYTVHSGGNPEWSQRTLRLSYGSLVTPSTVLSVDVATGERSILKQQRVLGTFDPARYEQRREWAIAADGTRIPISLVSATAVPGQPDDGPRPLHLYGYGSYESSIDPGFSIARLSMLDRGVIFAIAHVRGGGEMGRYWYEEGKLLAKNNTFTDFIACAEHLIARGYTVPERMVAEGGSAGGLLMGAVANLAPELWAGILASVPFVDPLTSILDPSLPLTVIEWDEWGDPLHNSDVYAYMKAYSPYENVRSDVRYPRILAMTSLNDTRVLYVEPAKWIARLRENNAPVLLKTEMTAGHGGVSGRYNAWRERAFELSWLLDVLGLAA